MGAVRLSITIMESLGKVVNGRLHFIFYKTRFFWYSNYKHFYKRNILRNIQAYKHANMQTNKQTYRSHYVTLGKKVLEGNK